MNEGFLPTVWFCLLGILLAGYAILDGLTLGVAIVLPFVGKTPEQRGSLFTAVGPFWAGYEVWLVAAGGAMIAAFPRLYADAFSGFYLVLALVLWLLIARGGSIEFRGQVADPMWKSFWDFVFWASSVLLALLYGAAFGNVIRGVPLDSTDNFQGTFALALNPYAIGVGLTSIALLALHGANFIVKRTEGDLEFQARQAARRIYPAVIVLIAMVTVTSFFARPDLGVHFAKHAWLIIVPLGTLAAILATGVFVYRPEKSGDTLPVAASAATIGLLMLSAGVSLYPRLLPALNTPQYDLTIANCASPPHILFTALLAYVLAIVFIAIYSIYVHRVFRGKMVEDEGYH
jgi:cytochrome bd ubiquinol oxidase subunit II